MYSKRIFLVGATGGLGGHILTGLLKQSDIHVVVYVRNAMKLRPVDPSKTTIVEGDLSSVDPNIMKGSDVIVTAHSSATNERHKGYQALISSAKNARIPRIIGVGGAGQLRLPSGQIKQTEEGWFPGLANVTADHQLGLKAVQESGLLWTWVAPPYMPKDAPSGGGYSANNDHWNDSGMLPQVDVAQFIIDEILSPRHIGHIVGLKKLD